MVMNRLLVTIPLRERIKKCKSRMGTQGWGKDETTRNVDSTNGDGTSADFYNH